MNFLHCDNVNKWNKSRKEFHKKVLSDDILYWQHKHMLTLLTTFGFVK